MTARYKQCFNCIYPVAISCGPAPDAPENGQQSGSGTTFGSTVTYAVTEGTLCKETRNVLAWPMDSGVGSLLNAPVSRFSNI